MQRLLPDEIMMKILNYCSFPDQKTLQLVNKNINRLINDPSTRLFKLKLKNKIKFTEIELYGDGSESGLDKLPLAVILLGVSIGIAIYKFLPSSEYGIF